MVLPHIVTVYNVVTEEDPQTFEATTTNYVTVLHGVLVDETKGRNVRESGLETADAVVLHIPRGIVAVDGFTGAKKAYVEPVAFFNAENKSGLWTFSADAGTFFIKGEVIETEWPLFSPADYDGILSVDGYLLAAKHGKPITEQYINLKYDSVYTVTKVDNKDFGRLAHWEVGGA